MQPDVQSAAVSSDGSKTIFEGAEERVCACGSAVLQGHSDSLYHWADGFLAGSDSADETSCLCKEVDTLSDACYAMKLNGFA